MIGLHTLGALDLRDADGREVRPVLAQPKRLALLAYLAVHRPQAFVRRDQVLSLLWPDQDDKHARAALNRAIYYLRRSLGESVLESRGDAIGISPGTFWCDAAEFEVAASDGRHGRAVELYRGDLLEGFHVSDAIEFERWLDEKRSRLREMARQSAWSLADAEQRAGNAGAAAHWARWAVARAPYDEASLQRLIRLLDASGDRAGAVREYELFVRRLQADLELSPSPETRALIESVRMREEALQGNGVVEPPVSGRGVVTVEPPVSGRGAVTVRAPAERDAATGAAPAVDSAALESSVASAASPGQRGPLADPLAGLLAGPSAGLLAGPSAGPSVGPSSGPLRRRLSRRRLAAAGAASLIAVGAPLAVVLLRPPPDPGQVVVALIENHTGFDTMDPLARAATDRIVRAVQEATRAAGEIMDAPAVRVIQRDDGGKQASRFALGGRAATVIHGSLESERGALELRVRVTDSRRRRISWEIPAIPVLPESDSEALREVSERASGAVFALLFFGSSFPVFTSPPAYPAMLEYLQAFRDHGRAIDHLERAAELDSTFTWAQLEVVPRLMMDDRAAADSLVLDLERKRDELNPLQSAVLSAHLADRVGDRRAKYDAMAAAARLAPERFLVHLAGSAWDLNRPREALGLYRRVDALRPQSPVPSTWLMQTHMLHELRDHGEELSLATRAREVQPIDPSALSMQIRALAALGNVREVRALVDTALAAPEKPAHPPGLVLMLAAHELRAHGHPAESVEIARRAADWYRSSRAFTREDSLEQDGRRAEALYLAGDWDEARAIYEQLVDRDPRYRVTYYGALGGIAARSNDRAGAEAYISALSALDIPKDAEPYEVALSRARIAAELGQADIALAFLLEGYRGGQGADLHTDPAFQWVLEHDRGFQEFVRPKG